MVYRGAALARAGLCLFLVLVAACSWLPRQPVAVVQPATDQREFRYVELPNKLRVLLISDPGADKAAASLDVNAGSRQDPADRQGLAHFLEHMLFLGTAKYPDAGEYQAFIGAHGGSHNAYTSFEHTNYFFDVAAEHLEPALDRFAQFFVAPLFNAEYVQREVNAVDSEYRARINDDQRRALDVLKELSNAEHPFSKFSVGSLSTLLGGRGEAALRQALLDFYDAHYSANRMALTVIGRQSLDELEALVRPRFEPVRNRDVAYEPIEQPLFAQAPLWVELEPKRELRELSLNFAVPDLRQHYRAKPLKYIGNLLGHEGAGSLLSLLKARGWAEALSAGGGLDYQGGGLFGVDIHLTEAGLAHADEIVALVFRAIADIRQAGINEWRYREQQTIGRQQFDYRARPDEIREASHFSHSLQRYPAEEVVRGPYLMEDFDAELIGELLAQMNPDNVVVALSAPGLGGERRSALYDVPYSLRPISADTLARWRSPAPAAELALPAKNAFIAENFTLRAATDASAVPRRLDSGGRTELWFKHDDDYELPKGNIHLLMRSPLAADSAEHSVLTELWERMVADQLNEFVYPAQLAGLNFQLQSTWRGMELAINGFDDKQALLLEEIVSTLGSPEPDERRFARVKTEYLRQLENRRELEPYRLVSSEMPRLLLRYQWPLEAMIASAREADFATLTTHVQQVMSATELSLLVYGNYSQEQARGFAAIAERYLQSEALPAAQPEAVLMLEPSERWHSLASDHRDAALMLYLQAPEVSKAARVTMGLAAQMLRADFFHQLRTEKQLGYIVTAGAYPLREVPGLMLLAQSPVADAATLQREFNQFLQGWLQREPLAAGFGQHRLALIQRLQEAPSNQWEAGDRYWRELLDGYTAFDSREQLIAALRAMSFDDWYGRLHRYLAGGQRRALWLQVGGASGPAELSGSSLTSPAAFKARRPYYHFP